MYTVYCTSVGLLYTTVLYGQFRKEFRQHDNWRSTYIRHTVFYWNYLHNTETLLEKLMLHHA